MHRTTVNKLSFVCFPHHHRTMMTTKAASRFRRRRGSMPSPTITSTSQLIQCQPSCPRPIARWSTPDWIQRTRCTILRFFLSQHSSCQDSETAADKTDLLGHPRGDFWDALPPTANLFLSFYTSLQKVEQIIYPRSQRAEIEPLFSSKSHILQIIPCGNKRSFFLLIWSKRCHQSVPKNVCDSIVLSNWVIQITENVLSAKCAAIICIIGVGL